MASSDNIIAFQSALQASVLVKCFCPLYRGKNCPKFSNLRKDKLTSRWKTGLQLSGQGGASLSAHMRKGLHFVVQSIAAVPRLDKNPSDPHKKEATFDSESQSSELQRGSKQISLEDLQERNPREYNRRLRISKAIKGKTAWNKGRKHSPETIERIRVRTKQAMQDPKVKEKLQNCGHPQSEETRMKIGMSVKRRIRQRDPYLREWRESIAEAARIGGVGEEELQWNAYEILEETLHEAMKAKHLKISQANFTRMKIGMSMKRRIRQQDPDLQEWRESIAEAARIGVVGEEVLQWNSYEILEEKLFKEAMKAKHQKISQAIKAKWADPEYRKRNIQSKRKQGSGKGKENFIFSTTSRYAILILENILAFFKNS